MNAGTLSVWVLTDNKPGHRNQLRGLVQRLEALADIRCQWIDANQHPLKLWQTWHGYNAAPDEPVPDMVLATGSGTHRLLLATKRHFRCFAAVLMKPNFPLSWVEAVIMPAHDNPPARANVLSTRGALNAIQPIPALPDAKRGLLLIGGISKHFGWDNAQVATQVATLTQEKPDWQWTLTDSRRTPPGLMQALAAAQLPNLTLCSHAQTGPDWMATQLAGNREVWVTPDSVSMVYEALTAGLPTGLFELPPASQGRVAQGLSTLISDRLVIPFDRRAPLDDDPARPQLWEADRAAKWLYNRFTGNYA